MRRSPTRSHPFPPSPLPPPRRTSQKRSPPAQAKYEPQKLEEANDAAIAAMKERAAALRQATPRSPHAHAHTHSTRPPTLNRSLPKPPALSPCPGRCRR